MSNRPQVTDPELKARAVRLVLEHRAQYPTTTLGMMTPVEHETAHSVALNSEPQPV